MSDVITNSRAATLARAAESMLRALGGGEVAVRCPVTPAGNPANAELGIEGPVAQDFAVPLVVVRSYTAPAADARVRFEFLFAPATLEQYLADRGQTADAFFTSALGIVHGQELLHIESVSTEFFAGAPYLYRIVAAE